MPITYDVIEHGGVVLQYWSSQVTRDEIVAHERRHLTDPRITPGASILVDAREAHFRLMPEEVPGLVHEFYVTYPRPMRIKKCALLLNELTYPLAETSSYRYRKSLC